MALSIVFQRGPTVSAFTHYIELVQRLSATEINRSENDLSSALKAALETFGLHAVLDTGGGDNRRVRPDISLYTDLFAADVGSAAEVIVEAKRPTELQGHPSLAAALASDWLWNEKFVPYVCAHAERIQFFLLTSFDGILIVPITDGIRRTVSSNQQLLLGTRHDILSNAL